MSAVVAKLAQAEPLDNKGSICEPWSDGVVSLFEMQQFFADIVIYELGALFFGEAKLGFEKDESHLVPGVGEWLYAKLNILQTLFDSYGMNSSAAQCRRVIEKINSKGSDILCGEMREGLKQLRERSEDELKAQFFLHLDLKEAVQFQNPEAEWQKAINVFPKIRHNVQECAKCFALQRYGASVFHVLQVAEFGVIKLADVFGVSGDKPGWGSLQRLQTLRSTPYSQRTGTAQLHSKLLDEFVDLAIVMKDRWRHKLDHVDNQIQWFDTDFSPEVAQEIILATRGFMRKLASDLPKYKTPPASGVWCDTLKRIFAQDECRCKVRIYYFLCCARFNASLGSSIPTAAPKPLAICLSRRSRIWLIANPGGRPLMVTPEPIPFAVASLSCISSSPSPLIFRLTIPTTRPVSLDMIGLPATPFTLGPWKYMVST